MGKATGKSQNVLKVISTEEKMDCVRKLVLVKMEQAGSEVEVVEVESRSQKSDI